MTNPSIFKRAVIALGTSAIAVNSYSLIQSSGENLFTHVIRIDDQFSFNFAEYRTCLLGEQNEILPIDDPIPAPITGKKIFKLGKPKQAQFEG